MITFLVFLKVEKLLTIPVLLLTFLIISLLMWVKKLTKTFRVGTVVQPFFVKGNFADSMFLSPVTSTEAYSYISQMDNNKSIGPYNIPVPLLKICKTHISPLLPSLMILFSVVFFPVKLKLAKVTPVFKKGSRQDKDNYRPISVLSIFSKIFEKALCKWLYDYLDLVTFFILFNLVLGKSARQIIL